MWSRGTVGGGGRIGWGFICWCEVIVEWGGVGVEVRQVVVGQVVLVVGMVGVGGKQMVIGLPRGGPMLIDFNSIGKGRASCK